MAPKKKPKAIPFAELPKQPKPKKYSTVNEAASWAAQRRKIQGPQDEVFRGAGPRRNGWSNAKKLNKATGNPSTHTEGLGPPGTGLKNPKSSKKHPYFRGGSMA